MLYQNVLAKLGLLVGTYNKYNSTNTSIKQKIVSKLKINVCQSPYLDRLRTSW